ncbi:unnamed protein product [Lactuca saligna]|uniref:Uncharacterized protein n=1 Tax=Lactuca saligna TaxID=75948 RepID=A0AA35ZJH7_LACSI|nr:unnamed protein product [Lactuca saligna]CAI9288574.1 unnamed protein product [Lactuca saligna]CAI9293281.1 unnamed protein product [Lactuca saligna]
MLRISYLPGVLFPLSRCRSQVPLLIFEMPGLFKSDLLTFDVVG